MNFDKAKNRSKDTTMSERLYISPVINTNQTVKDSQFHPHFRPLDPLSHNPVLRVIDSSHTSARENKNVPLHEYDEYVCGCGCDCCCGCGHDL
ncbi:hypothetical protein [Cedecea colo]|uniref:Uncharacterized protein n=1 Tax=Cedecea colo TaxID=2552946 RepID=A0ABX0VH53_9ENTR|nr:hypothetical protein [Cedecea colo]NIY46311.1 hypothetical protein [Cedecea colo]